MSYFDLTEKQQELARSYGHVALFAERETMAEANAYAQGIIDACGTCKEAAANLITFLAEAVRSQRKEEYEEALRDLIALGHMAPYILTAAYIIINTAVILRVLVETDV